MGFGQLGSLMNGLDSLIWVHAYTLDRHRHRADSDARRARIERLSYNSPLEVIFSVSVGTGAGLVLANRMIDTFERYQNARVTRAGADLRVAEDRVIRDEIERMRPKRAKVETLLPAGRAKSAAVALAALESLRVIPEDDV